MRNKQSPEHGLPGFCGNRLGAAVELCLALSVAKHHGRQKNQCRQSAGQGSQSTACRAVGSRRCSVCKPPDKQIGGHNADSGVNHLFNNLRYRGGDHIAKALEISPYNAHNRKYKHGRSHNGQGKGASGTFENGFCDPGGAKQQNCSHGGSYGDAEGHTAQVDAAGILVTSADSPGCNQLGNSQRQTVGGQNQSDVVDFIGSIVVANTFRPQNPGHGHLV